MTTTPRPEEIADILMAAAEKRGAHAIAVETDYTEYADWPGHEGLNPGQSPHGAWHVVKVNRTLREALPSPDGTAPAGTIVVKENYNADQELAKITVMAKAPGFDPAAGFWGFVELVVSR